MSKITKLEQFEKVKKNGIGYIVITDKPTKTQTLHRSKCPHVDVRNFTKKVIDNREENGSYYWYRDKRVAIQERDPVECLVCK
ncbi:hypothetical protein [Bacillus sp. FJAT-50079]|uniref:hypothetical protein n=1 Tax=Bacillus sp. FJAT-50079 TaxID=2833577 RepID=UPI001BC9CE83|nr:hypothetical protein [Bacillus sp. FJAT-50079]MBS4209515.1 hypothetical protein [Bacillus sp. FJAT-50079]